MSNTDQIYMLVVDKEVNLLSECNTFCTKDVSAVKRYLDKSNSNCHEYYCCRVWKFPQMIEILSAEVVLTTE